MKLGPRGIWSVSRSPYGFYPTELSPGPRASDFVVCKKGEGAVSRRLAKWRETAAEDWD